MGDFGGEWTKPHGCRVDYRHTTAQQLSDRLEALVMEGDPALVEGETKGWKLGDRFAFSDIAHGPMLSGRSAEVVLGGRQ
jgi:hypothetical protein